MNDSLPKKDSKGGSGTGKKGVYGYSIVTDPGLVKRVNEDGVGFTDEFHSARFIVADGHWGDDAARAVLEHWLAVEKFPRSRDEAIVQTKLVEDALYKKWGSLNMDASKDFTPEAAFVAADLFDDGELRLASYGDCRAMVVRGGDIIFSLEQNSTWLGVFSSLGLRGRSSVEDTVQYSRMKLRQGDTLLLFSDGIDECIYGKPTISMEDLAWHTACSKSLANLKKRILDIVIEKGAEDNYSLVLVKHL